MISFIHFFPVDRLLFYAWIRTCPISDYKWILAKVPEFASMGCWCLSDVLNEEFTSHTDSTEV